jgi:hypothetical protein
MVRRSQALEREVEIQTPREIGGDQPLILRSDRIDRFPPAAGAVIFP